MRSRRDLTLYALPGLATALPTLPVLVLLPQYYATATTLSLASIGLALLIARLLDMATDPAVGWLMDTVPTRWGRRKPWMLLGGLFAAPALIVLSLPSADTTLFQLALFLCALYVGWTFFSIPYNALGAELARDAYERTRFASAREAATLAGIVLASALPVVLKAAGVVTEDQFFAIAIITIVTGAITITMLLAVVQEDEHVPPAPVHQTEAQWRGFFASLKGNTPFVVILSAWFFNGLANGTGTVLFPFFLSDALKTTEQQKNLLIFLYFFCAIAGLPIWLVLSKHFDKARLWLCSIIIVSVTFTTVPFLPEGAVLEFGIICVITGVCLGADLALPASLFADVTDWDELQTKRKRRGILYSSWTLVAKLSLALAAGFCLPLVGALGFTPGADNTPEALTALAVIYALLPVSLKMGVLWLMWRFPITTKAHRSIQRRLEVRERA
ncbi:MFS transporter [Pseudovibrio sp. SPO723]|uniref:MFS transporter n=1 Tax=Nesiotobacter zosterae TaxID=392721 RepID=UPI0029C1BA25|nr:MFS transporter [Pseudovibrio sp. SPO723]MDX5593238.1 MFS transporter [Pseudovibrio sp. SPO723]